MAQHRCNTCNKELTREERRFYGNSCDQCERAETDRVDDWRLGRCEDPDLDRIYDAAAEQSTLN